MAHLKPVDRPHRGSAANPLSLGVSPLTKGLFLEDFVTLVVKKKV